MRKITKKHLLSLALCAALLCASFAPLQVFASVDEGGGFEDGETSAAQDEAGDSTADESDTTSTPEVGTNNAAIQQLESKITEANTKLESIKKEQERIQSLVNGAKDEREKAEQVAANFSYQISMTQEEIAQLEGKIGNLEEKIELKQEDIRSKQDELDVKYDQFKMRIRAKYMQDDGTALGLLVGTDSFSDFLTGTEYMARIAEYDRGLMADLSEQKKELEGEKEALEEDRKQQEADKVLTQEKKQELSQHYTVAAAQVQDYDEMERAYRADLEKNKAMQDQMKAEIDKLYKDLEFSKNPYVGGVMQWPLPGFTLITSRYGLRFGGSDFHTGTDISGSGCFGAPVIAANDGVVAFVNTQYVQGSGYGKYILIDHGVNDQGQSVSTLYAHLNDVSVSTGQTVTKGQTIGACGSTGWSTGPHLHFEVRLNGQHVNSLPYITTS